VHELRVASCLRRFPGSTSKIFEHGDSSRSSRSKEQPKQSTRITSVLDEPWPPYCCVILEGAAEHTGLLFVEERSHSAKVAGGQLTCFGGKRESAEAPYECALRELQEELRWNPTGEVRRVCDLYVDGELIAWFYQARGPSSEEEATLQFEEGRRGIWVEPEDPRFSAWHASTLMAYAAGRPRADFTSTQVPITVTRGAARQEHGSTSQRQQQSATREEEIRTANLQDPLDEGFERQWRAAEKAANAIASGGGALPETKTKWRREETTQQGRTVANGQTPQEDRESPGASRRLQLKKIFAAFDYDNSGAVEPEELLVLGQRRRALGQKERIWTEERNARLVSRMDKNKDGQIDEDEFVDHFLEALETLSDEVFLQTMVDFAVCVPQGEDASGESTLAKETAAADPLDAKFEKQWRAGEKAAKQLYELSNNDSSMKNSDLMEQPPPSSQGLALFDVAAAELGGGDDAGMAEPESVAGTDDEAEILNEECAEVEVKDTEHELVVPEAESQNISSEIDSAGKAPETTTRPSSQRDALIDRACAITSDVLEKFLTNILMAAGLQAEESQAEARAMIFAQRRGDTTQGVQRVPALVSQAQKSNSGYSNSPSEDLVITRSTCDELVELAKQLGVEEVPTSIL